MPHARVIRSGLLAANALLDLTAPLFASGSRQPTLLKVDGPRRVLRVTPAIHPPYILKTWPLSLAHRIRVLAGLSRAHTQAQGAELLARRGFPAAEALGILQTARAPWSRSAELWLLIPLIEGTSLLAALRDPAHTLHTSAGLQLARTLGTHIASLAGSGLLNRDHKPSNLILSGDLVSPPTLIDTAGIRHARSPRPRTPRARMLASLYIEPSGLRPPCPPRLTLCLAAARAAAQGNRDEAKALFRAARQIIQDHGDPTPRIMP